MVLASIDDHHLDPLGCVNVFCFFYFYHSTSCFSYDSLKKKKSSFINYFTALKYNSYRKDDVLSHLKYKLFESGRYRYHFFCRCLRGADWGFLQHAIPFPAQLVEHLMPTLLILTLCIIFLPALHLGNI